jgi:TolB protein
VEAGAYVYDVDIGSTTKVNDNCGLKWGPDSTTLTYASDNDIFIMNADGSGTRQLTEGAVVGGWSSDGAWLSYGTDSCETGDNDIYVVSRDGSTSFKVTNSPESLKESASWSSAMDEIAYSVKLGDTSHALQVVGVDGQPPKTALTSPFHIHAPTWSPDGRILSFTVGGGHGAC